MELAELDRYFGEVFGEKGYRALQAFGWLHEKHAASFDEMTNLPKALRTALKEQAVLSTAELVSLQKSRTDGTRKYLFRFADGASVESVLMRYRFGDTVCISSQAGCRMGCAFCASGITGLSRNLSAGEMLEQIYGIERESGLSVERVVVMGTGEPFDNFEALSRFLRLLTSPGTRHMSQRHVTVSTCGLVDKIYAFAAGGWKANLAVSLHAAVQEKREQIMPIAKRYSLPELLAACRACFDATGRRVTFEYSLIRGFNDQREDIEALTRLLSGFPCHVNLIPVNPVAEKGFLPPSSRDCVQFQKKLAKNGINVTMRRELGRDIDGACGQLRLKYSRSAQEAGFLSASYISGKEERDP